MVYEKNGGQPVTNLYIQLDNTNYNKSRGLFSALSSLIQTGLVQKVCVLQLSFILTDVKCMQIKVSYLIVGHTHADVDALIGTIVSYLRNIDQMCPEEFAEAVGEACKTEDGTIDRIENTLSTPDYEGGFEAQRLRIEGHSEVREVRLTHNDDTGGVVLHYKVLLL
jgi:hypothetical protein